MILRLRLSDLFSKTLVKWAISQKWRPSGFPGFRGVRDLPSTPSYAVLAGIRNTTTIRHAPGILEIVHHPYSRFFGGGRWDTGTFASLHFETILGSKDSVSYRLTAKQTDGESVKLVSEDRDTTRFLAHELAVAMKLPLDESA